MSIPSTSLTHGDLKGEQLRAAAASEPRLLLTRAETLATLRIGETTLHWIVRTEKLNPIHIGSRVLFSRADVERLARRGCTLTEAEKHAAAQARKQNTS
jgi:hypothetical protein